MNSGQTFFVSAARIDSGNTISNTGLEIVLSGGKTVGATVSGGGAIGVNSRGIASGTLVGSDGNGRGSALVVIRQPVSTVPADIPDTRNLRL